MFRLAFAAYRAARALGLNVDIIPPNCADLSGYSLVLAPGIMTLSDPLRNALADYKGIALIGPRTDTKTDELAIPVPLGPNLPGVDVTISLAESLPPGAKVKLAGKGSLRHWFEHLEGSADVHMSTRDGQPVIMGNEHLRYLAGWPGDKTFARIIGGLCDEAEIETTAMPDGLRLRTTSTHRFVFNYAPEAQSWNGQDIPAAGVLWEGL